MNRLRSILVGVDFSNHSRAALAQAVRISTWNGAKLNLVHVIDALVLADLGRLLKAPEGSLRGEARKATRERLKEFHRPLDDLEVKVREDVLVGNPFVELVREVKNIRADLLVLGATGAFNRSGSAGSLAAKCVRKAPTKVMLVREDHSDPFQRVVACVDFSETSKQVVEQAARVAKQDGSELHLLHVFAAPWDNLHWMAPTRQASPEYQRQFLQALEDELRGFSGPILEKEGVEPTEWHLRSHAEAAQGILDFLGEVDADLAVLGTKGRAGLKSLIIGTTAERIVQSSPCSILTLKPEGFDYPID